MSTFRSEQLRPPFIFSGSLSQGANTSASGDYSHAEGLLTLASGQYSHAEGQYTTASGVASHTEGGATIAIGDYSHAEGLRTIALGDYQHVQGRYNLTSSIQSAFIVGNGADDNNRSNLIHAANTTVEITGLLEVTGSLNVSGSITVNGIGVSLIKARRQDFVYPFSYCGTAPSGSADASTVWTIVRINISGSTDTIGTATNVAWTNRYSAIYV